LEPSHIQRQQAAASNNQTAIASHANRRLRIIIHSHAGNSGVRLRSSETLMVQDCYEFELKTKNSAYKVFEYQTNLICRYCNKQFSIRSYFETGTSKEKATVFNELKRTICCGCRIKTVLQNGLVFVHKSDDEEEPMGKKPLGDYRLQKTNKAPKHLSV
jgi:hypothetical protein